MLVRCDHKCEEIENLSLNVSVAIFKATNDIDRLIQNREANIVRTLSRTWNKQNIQLKKIINKKFVGTKNPKVSDEKWLLSNIDNLFHNFSEPVNESIEKQVNFIYKISKKYFVGLNEIQPIAKKDFTIIPAFTGVDETTISKISEQQSISSNVFYRRNLSKEVSQIVNETFKEGLNLTNTGKQLQIRLKNILGLKKGISDLKIIPSGYTGSVESYFKGLGDTTLNRARTYSSINALVDAEILEYVISAIRDNKTSVICFQMHGRTFKVSQGISLMNNVLNSKTPNDVKEVAGWRKDLSEFGVTRQREKINDKKLNNKLASSGMALPLYHFRCRTTIEPR